MTKTKVMEVEKLRKTTQITGPYDTDLQNLFLKMRP